MDINLEYVKKKKSLVLLGLLLQNAICRFNFKDKGMPRLFVPIYCGNGGSNEELEPPDQRMAAPAVA